ncbi:hypothetical protein QQ054_37480 [Oscillatoria amoena NRMC-F 0135]|nr:hypothetical protein [Oscillatoria amoena NRMC-F 0135]
MNFVGQINAMYEAGARVFVELGPKSVLTNLVRSILAEKEYVAVAVDGQRGGELRGLLMALGTLMTAGVNLQLTALYADRNVQFLELSRLVELTRKPPLSPSTWLVEGGSIRQPSETVGYTGKLPPRTAQPQTPPPPVFTRRTQSMVVPHSSPEMRPKSDPFRTRAQPPVSGDVALSAYLSYQETMRQFLAVQEQVMKQFLGGNPARLPKEREPISLLQLSNGNGNGNGHYSPPVETSLPVESLPVAVAPPPPVESLPVAAAPPPGGSDRSRQPNAPAGATGERSHGLPNGNVGLRSRY